MGKKNCSSRCSQRIQKFQEFENRPLEIQNSIDMELVKSRGNAIGNDYKNQYAKWLQWVNWNDHEGEWVDKTCQNGKSWHVKEWWKFDKRSGNENMKQYNKKSGYDRKWKIN